MRPHQKVKLQPHVVVSRVDEPEPLSMLQLTKPVPSLIISIPFRTGGYTRAR